MHQVDEIDETIGLLNPVCTPFEPARTNYFSVYLIESGRFKEAFNYLENALILDFDGHNTLFDFFTKIETQKALYKIIEQLRKDNH